MANLLGESAEDFVILMLKPRCLALFDSGLSINRFVSVQNKPLSYQPLFKNFKQNKTMGLKLPHRLKISPHNSNVSIGKKFQILKNIT